MRRGSVAPRPNSSPTPRGGQTGDGPTYTRGAVREGRGGSRAHGENPMNLNARSLLLIVAVILFVLEALGVGLGAVSLVSLGLAAFAGAFLVADMPLGRRL
jgi:hypothetical protein